MNDLGKKPDLDRTPSEPAGRRFAGELLPRLMLGCLPSPIAAIFEAVEACSTADELAEKFDSLKASVKEYVDDSKNLLPMIPLEVDVCLPSTVVLNFDQQLSTEDVSALKDALRDSEDLEWVCEIDVDTSRAIFNLDAPGDKSEVLDELVDPAKTILDEFNIRIKSILYA